MSSTSDAQAARAVGGSVPETISRFMIANTAGSTTAKPT